jgi:hypothetical protein
MASQIKNSKPTSVLHDIFAWSIGRPAWQCDALRRIITKDKLDDSDRIELEHLCRQTEGAIATNGKALVVAPLAEEHLPAGPNAQASVSIEYLNNLTGVNRLPSAQKITFGPMPGLTVVYGDNGTGKSGYVRVIKKACRTRGAPPVIQPFKRLVEERKLGNIIFKETETSPLINVAGKQSKWNIYTKIWLNDRLEEGSLPLDMFDKFENRHSSQELSELGIPFDFAKPMELIAYLSTICGTAENDIMMDFFAGSGTTAHAALEQNKQDGGHRRFILVQLPEPTGRTDFSTVADITKERVRRVIKKLNEADQNQLALSEDKKQDRGFKVFKLQSSNFKAWNTEQPKDDAELVKQLTLHVDHLVTGRNQEDVLYELLLKSGFPLDTKVQKISLTGKSVFSIADGAMLICLEKELTPEVIKAMAEKKPERVVCLDAGFADNDQLKTNAVQTMKSKGVTKFQTV